MYHPACDSLFPNLGSSHGTWDSICAFLSKIFQVMNTIPSLMTIRPEPRIFHASRLNQWVCHQCGKDFEKKNSLNRHIRDKHIEKIKCDFCNYQVPKGRLARLDRHMLLKHKFPAAPLSSGPMPMMCFFDNHSAVTPMPSPSPAPSPAMEDLSSLFPVEELDVSNIPEITLPSSPLPSPIAAPRPSSPQSTIPSSPSPFLPPHPVPSTSPAPISRSSTPLLDELPISQLPDLDEVEFSQDPTNPELAAACAAAVPHVLESEPNGYTPPMAAASKPSPVSPDQPQQRNAEVEEAVRSLLPYLEDKATSSPLLVPDYSSELDVQETSGASASLDAASEGPTPTPLDPNDPRHFFHGAPSVSDNSETARLIREARDRAMRAEFDGYRVEFSVLNVLCIQKKESITLPDGTVYSLTSCWLENPTPITPEANH